MKKESDWQKYVIGVVVVLAAVYFIGFAGKTCDSIECFVGKANECASVTYEVQEEYGLMLYSAEDCRFTKTVVKMDESEDPELRGLIEGKSLNCGYPEGMFNTRWMYSLLADMDQCEGELKDVMEQVIVFN